MASKLIVVLDPPQLETPKDQAIPYPNLGSVTPLTEPIFLPAFHRDLQHSYTLYKLNQLALYSSDPKS